MAHNQFDLLEKLVRLLDDERNDIYLHIDKKVMHFPMEKIKNAVKYSSLIFVERISVYWGDFSQILAEMSLLESAVLKKYEYYHLLSGVDLPLKNQDEIHKFFDNNTKDYVQFVNKEYFDKTNAFFRLSRYKFFQKYVRSKNCIKRSLSNIFQNIFMPLQTVLHVNRLRNKTITVGYGANWFSITNKTAELIISKKDFIYKNFKHTLCADELFVQTIIATFTQCEITYDQDFNGHSHLRCIDWERGNPYVFTIEDISYLFESECLFARKFDYEKDKEIVEYIYNRLK